MKYAIVYSSQTGNTALLAEKIKSCLPAQELIYTGAPDIKAIEADFIFVGFWTDKGSCDETIADFLKNLRDKDIFLFGTAGFGGSSAYFSQILHRVMLNLDSSNQIAGTYMCQGKMPLSVRERYEAMAAIDPDKAQPMLANFDKALSHPDESDLEYLESAVKKALPVL